MDKRRDKRKTNPVVAAGLALSMLAAPLTGIVAAAPTTALAESSYEIRKNGVDETPSADVAITRNLHISDSSVTFSTDRPDIYKKLTETIQTVRTNSEVYASYASPVIADVSALELGEDETALPGSFDIVFPAVCDVKGSDEPADLHLHISEVTIDCGAGLQSRGIEGFILVGGSSRSLSLNSMPYKAVDDQGRYPVETYTKSYGYINGIKMTCVATIERDGVPIEGDVQMFFSDLDVPRAMAVSNPLRAVDPEGRARQVPNDYSESVRLGYGFAGTLWADSGSLLGFRDTNQLVRVDREYDHVDDSYSGGGDEWCSNLMSGAVAMADASRFEFTWASSTLSGSIFFKSFEQQKIVATSSEGGTITNKGEISTNWKWDYTYTMLPAEGYRVADVVVDGVSVGAVDEYTFEEVVEDHKIHVEFEPIAYEVAFDKNAPDAAGEMPNQDMEYDAPENLDGLAYEREGWDFAGWNTAPDGSGERYADAQEVVNLTAEDGVIVTLYAQWMPHEDTAYKVVHRRASEVDPFSSEDKTGTTGEMTDATPVDLVGYKPEPFEQAEIAGDGSTVVEIVYQAVPYKIAFDKNAEDASGDMPDQDMEYDVTEPLDALAFEREGYTWLGWNTEPDGTGVTYTDAQEVVNLTYEDGRIVTLYAQWGKKPTVTYVDALTGETIEEEIVEYGGTSEKPEIPVHPGYRPLEWDTPDDKLANIVEDMTVTIDFAPIAYEVAFDANGGTGDMDNQRMRFDEPEELKQNLFMREGYTWLGWNTEPDGTGVTYTDAQEVVNLTYEDGRIVTLYAQWKKLLSATWIDPLAENPVVKNGSAEDPYTIAAPIDPAHEGYTFKGWALEVDPEGNLTYTAQWESVPAPEPEPTQEPQPTPTPAPDPTPTPEPQKEEEKKEDTTPSSSSTVKTITTTPVKSSATAVKPTTATSRPSRAQVNELAKTADPSEIGAIIASGAGGAILSAAAVQMRRFRKKNQG